VKGIKILGITGQFCSGKSTVAAMFAAFGASVIDVDKLGHNILSDKKVKKGLIDYFGKDILSSGRINRKRLAHKAFSSKSAHRVLCRIVHPQLAKAAIEKIKRLKRKKFRGIVIIDAAVLIEMGLSKHIDKLVFVWLPHAKQIRRARLKWRLPRLDIERRIHLQLPVSTLVKKADFIIDNSGSMAETKKQVKEIYKKIAPRD